MVTKWRKGKWPKLASGSSVLTGYQKVKIELCINAVLSGKFIFDSNGLGRLKLL